MKTECKFLSVAVVDRTSEEAPRFLYREVLPRVCDWRGLAGEEGTPLSRGNDPSNGAN